MNDIRQTISDGICPICGKGRYRDVGVHIRQAHDITLAEFKVQNGFFADDVLMSPETKERKRDQALKHGLGTAIHPAKAVGK